MKDSLKNRAGRPSAIERAMAPEPAPEALPQIVKPPDGPLKLRCQSCGKLFPAVQVRGGLADGKALYQCTTGCMRRYYLNDADIKRMADLAKAVK